MLDLAGLPRGAFAGALGYNLGRFQSQAKVFDYFLRAVLGHLEADAAWLRRTLRENRPVTETYEIGAAVLMEADYHPQAGKSAASKNRLRIEGACLSACRDNTALVQVMNGPAIGKACGTSKADALTAARGLGVSEEYVEATAAALAAKSILS